MLEGNPVELLSPPRPSYPFAIDNAENTETLISTQEENEATVPQQPIAGTSNTGLGQPDPTSFDSYQREYERLTHGPVPRLFTAHDLPPRTAGFDHLRGLCKELYFDQLQTQPNRYSNNPDHDDISGEPLARASIPLSNRTSTIQHKRERSPTPRSPRTRGDRARAQHDESRTAVESPPSLQSSDNRELPRELLHDVRPVAPINAIYRYGVDIDFNDIPISVRVESTRRVTHLSYYPDEPDACVRVNFEY